MNIKLSSAWLGRLVMVLTMANISFAAHADNDKDKSKHKIKYKVMQNTSYEDCHWAGEVILDARYKFHKAESGQLLVETSADGQTYTELQNHELDGRRGQLTLSFDAGDCLKDVRLSLNAD